MTWQVCACGTPFNAGSGATHCSAGCRHRASITRSGLVRTGPLDRDEIEWWLNELSHKPDGIGGGVRRVLGRALVQLRDLTERASACL